MEINIKKHPVWGSERNSVLMKKEAKSDKNSENTVKNGIMIVKISENIFISYYFYFILFYPQT